MRGIPAVTRAVVCAAAVTVLIQPTAGHAEPPGIPSAAEARTMLEGLTVAEEGSAAGYSRDAFPHWSTVSDGCTARETVLQRDGTGVTVDEECRPTAGTWFSPYDDQTVADASDVDIDHVLSAAASGV
ncbi:hypothetical protein [Nocardia sp. NPDC051750]|uniref:hypothetical protein n=1 Tax=Nocardia sp. NPDC051750 TaxID=3364325 RepID=UPI0037AB7E92